MNHRGRLGLPASILPGQCVAGACVAYRVAYPPGNLPRPPAFPASPSRQFSSSSPNPPRSRRPPLGRLAPRPFPFPVAPSTSPPSPLYPRPPSVPGPSPLPRPGHGRPSLVRASTRHLRLAGRGGCLGRSSVPMFHDCHAGRLPGRLDALPIPAMNARVNVPASVRHVRPRPRPGASMERNRRNPTRSPRQPGNRHSQGGRSRRRGQVHAAGHWIAGLPRREPSRGATAAGCPGGSPAD